MRDLSELREEINYVDDKLIELFEKRMNISIEIAKYKNKNNLKICNTAREIEVLEKNLKKIRNENFLDESKLFIQTLMTLSKKVQQKYINCK